MEFGQVKDISQVDFTMPPDHPDTSILLKQYPLLRSRDIHLGCAKWGRKDWIGKIYPQGIKEKDFLENYVKHYNSVELNATYHVIPAPNTIKGWAEKTTEDFLFCPKFPKIISHQKVLKGTAESTQAFAMSIKLFGKHLGPAFLQLPPFFSPREYKVLLEYLETLEYFPTKVFIEFRHKDWFRPSEETEIIFDSLKKYKTGTVITDTAGRRDCLHQRLTVPHVFVRFVGNRLHQTDFTRINDWAEKLDDWFQQGLQSAYFFIHNDSDKAEGLSPELSGYTAKRFNRVLKTALPEPGLIKTY